MSLYPRNLTQGPARLSELGLRRLRSAVGQAVRPLPVASHPARTRAVFPGTVLRHYAYGPALSHDYPAYFNLTTANKGERWGLRRLGAYWF